MPKRPPSTAGGEGPEALQSLPLGERVRALGDGQRQAGPPAAPAPPRKRQKQQPAPAAGQGPRSKAEPRALSSRAPVSQRRQVVQLPKRRRLDPRFEGVLPEASSSSGGGGGGKGKAPAAGQGRARKAPAAKQGNFFLKKSEQKRQALVERFHSLKASGRLQKAMAKRRKRVAASDHRYLPGAGRERQGR